MATKKDTPKPAAPSTALAVKKTAGNIVAIKEALAAQVAAMNERTAPPSGSKIKIPQGGGKFTLPNGQEVADQMDAVIVDFRAVHNFYPGKYDKNKIVPPSCFAVGMNPKAMAPVDASPLKQATDCQSCAQNQFGSEGTGKACKNGRRLALLPPNDAGDDVDHEADMWVLDVSPTALKNFDGFVQSVARMFQLPPAGVLVTIGFDTSVEHAKLVFSNPRPIASVGEVLGRQAEAKEMLEAQPDFSSLIAANDAKAAPARKVANARR